MTLWSFLSTATTAESVVRIGDTFCVTHEFVPTTNPKVYAILVTVKNISEDTVDARYRRVMDWDIPPTEFDEYVSVGQGAATFSSNNGFASANPLAGPSDLGYTGSFTTSESFDQGALFDFSLGNLAPGYAASFTLYYGVGGTPGETTSRAWPSEPGDTFAFGHKKGGVAPTTTCACCHPDLDVDSNNDSGFNVPADDPAEDEIEDDPGLPGKVIAVNDGDDDGDGIPNFVEGYNFDGSAGSNDDQPAGTFTPLVIRRGLPHLDVLRLKFQYDASHPLLDVDPPGIGNESYRITNGHLRIWLKDGDQVRTIDDFVTPEQTYDAIELGFTASADVTLFIEAVDSAGIADQRITVLADPDGPGPAGFVGSDAVRVTPVMLSVGVDRNRDGLITADGKDSTIPDKPLRFWLNDDSGGYDNGGGGGLGGGAVDIVGGAPDSSTPKIGSDVGTDNVASRLREVFRRDLEDFAQIGMLLSDSLWELTDKVLVGIENTTNPLMSLRLWHSAPSASAEPREFSATAHVTDPVVAEAILNETYNFLNDDGNSFAVIGTDDPFEFTRTSFDQHFGVYPAPNSERVSQLMFEGINAGAGKLVFKFLRGNQELAESKIHLDLHSIKDFYEHHTIARGPGVGTEGDWSSSGTGFDPKVTPVQTTPHFESGQQASSYATTNDYLVFVHGWNMSATGRQSFAGTAYKRLYWQGYRGTMGMFSWPTQFTPNPVFDPGNFNRSEEVAWHSAQGLLNLIEDKQSVRSGGGKLIVLGHSMGGIVVSEALKLAGIQNVADTVILTQAAVSSELYQGFATPTSLYPAFAGQVGGNNPRFAHLDDAASKIVNFNNEVDYALNIGWVSNTNAKPGGPFHGNPEQPGFGGALYAGVAGPPVAITRTVPGNAAVILGINVDAYEMFAHGFHSPSFIYQYGAVGAIDAAVQPFHTKVNLRNTRYGFSDSRIDHSGQFNHSYIEMGNYWDEVMKQAGLE